MGKEATLTVEGLSKSYRNKRGINEVSFEVMQGEVFGFLGPNGAGKTTTIRLLMALLRADKGQARIAGMDVWEDSVAIKRLVGYVPGEPALDGGLRGGQILEYFANLRGGVDKAWLKQLVERLDLDLSRKYRQYSSGNKRKVVLVQAFMHRPKVLILDEPTNGLDPLGQQEFARMVQEVKEEGRTVFLSSHMLSEVEQTCTRVGIIREGKMVRIGSVSELKDIKRHEITITFKEANVPVAAFDHLAGVSGVEMGLDGHTMRMSVQGEADGVVKAAAKYGVVSLNSHEPSLEDIFLRYYEGEKTGGKEKSDVAE
jgi:ABC-2 type transport system ATP-binding protein